MTLGMHDPFERRCREAGPGNGPRPASLGPSPHAIVRPAALRVYRSRPNAPQVALRMRPAAFFGDGRAKMIAVERISHPQGPARPAGAGARWSRSCAPSPPPRRSSRRSRRAGKPMSVRMTAAAGSAGSPTAAAIATSRGIPRARPGRRSRRVGARRSGASSCRDRPRPRLLPRQLLRRGRAHGTAPRRRRGRLLLAGAVDLARRPRALPHGRASSAATRPPRSCSRAATSW